MKFAYTRVPSLVPGRDAYRPMVRAKLFGPRRSIRIDMLVDSGSDESMVPLTFLEAIGATFTGETVELAGIGGGKHVARVAEVRVEVAGHTYAGRLMGVEAAAGELALLGQRDFFPNFTVTFDRAAGIFFVSRRTTNRAQ